MRYDGIFSPRLAAGGPIAREHEQVPRDARVNEWIYTDLRPRSVPQRRPRGGLGFFEQNDGRNLQFGLKSTHIFNGGGNHQIRYGVQYEDIDFTRGTDYSGPNLHARRWTHHRRPAVRSRSARAPASTFYRATRGQLVPPRSTTQNYVNFFIQDTWQIGRLTLRPGIRYERQ